MITSLDKGDFIMKDLVVEQDQLKQFKFVLLGLTMVLASLLVLIMGSSKSNVVFVMIGIMGTIFFGFCFLFILKRFIFPKAILMVDSRGITDHSSATSVGLIPWEEIEDVFMTQTFNQEFITIKLNNTATRLSEKNFVRSIFNKCNTALYSEGQICITLQSTRADINEVLKIILERFDEFKYTNN